MPPLWQYFLRLQNELSAATQAGKTYFGPQTRVDDTVAGKHACMVTRVGRSWAVPPSVTPLTICSASSARGTEEPGCDCNRRSGRGRSQRSGPASAWF
jgi:hypothetical protein